MTWTSLSLWAFFSMPLPVVAAAPPAPVVATKSATCDLTGVLSLVDDAGKRKRLQFAQVFLSDPVRPFNQPLRPREEPIVLGQTREMLHWQFAPRFLVVQKDEVVRVMNEGALEAHEVHCFNDHNVFATPLTQKSITVEQLFDELGTSVLLCKKHASMSAFVLTVPNQQRVTPNADGSFTLPGLPRGQVEVTFWQAGDVPGGLQYSFERVRVDACAPIRHTLAVGPLVKVPCDNPYGCTGM